MSYEYLSREIIAVLKRYKGLNLEKIVSSVNVSREAAQNVLRRMIKEKTVYLDDGRYFIR